jgi:hypothetical protein
MRAPNLALKLVLVVASAFAASPARAQQAALPLPREAVPLAAPSSPAPPPFAGDGYTFTPMRSPLGLPLPPPRNARRKTGMLASGVAVAVVGVVLIAVGTWLVIGGRQSAGDEEQDDGISGLESRVGWLLVSFGAAHVLAGVPLATVGGLSFRSVAPATADLGSRLSPSLPPPTRSAGVQWAF